MEEAIGWQVRRAQQHDGGTQHGGEKQNAGVRQDGGLQDGGAQQNGVDGKIVAGRGGISFGNGRALVAFDSSLSADEHKLLSRLLDWFKEGTKYSEVEGEQKTRAFLHSLLGKMAAARSLAPQRAEVIIECALHSLAGYGVLDFLLAEEELEEISVLGIGLPIFVYHRQRGWLETNCSFTSFEAAVNAVNKMARPLGRRVTYQTPRINATLPDGSRLHATIPPVCGNGIEISIRKFSADPYAVSDLISNQTISAEAASLLWLAMFSDLSLLVAGNTGSGKTTTLNALFSFIPANERIVITEETPEIRLPHPHVVRLAANQELGISLRELVQDTLRMRPDRVIIGEVRSKHEVEALSDCLLAGQARGSYCTFHAKTAADALSRLKTLGAREDEVSAIDLVLVQRRIPLYDRKARRAFEQRRVTEISLYAKRQLTPLFKYDFPSGSLKPNSSGIKLLFSRLSASYSMSGKELEAEWRERTEFLGKLAAGESGTPRASFKQFTDSVQQYSFTNE